MIEVKEETLESTLRKVIQGLQPSKSRLVSFTKRVDKVDPLQFFEAGYHLHMNRSYWKSTIDNFTLVGIGNAFSIREENPYLLKDKWNALLNQAVINNPYQLSGTGIVSIGGMDFDPLKSKTRLWQNFSSNELRVPQFMLMVNEERAYLTVTVNVTSNDDPVAISEELTKNEEYLFKDNKLVSNNPTIVEKEEVEPENWKKTVRKATEHISSGQAKKVVLARELRLKFTEEVQVSGVLRQLLESQPTSYIFAYEQGKDCFVGATPERLVKVERNELLSTCLAGTAPRGTNEAEDNELGHKLLHDVKNRKEHEFVVQMIKQSLEEFCKEINVPEHPVLYKLRNLQHLYTPVRGVFKEEQSIFDVVQKLHPTPALGGEPREEALTFIREQELLDRGWYGAPIGWIDSNQHGEFAVAIRSALLQGDKASLFAGCGVVKDSDPEAEFEETRIKFLPMLNVLGG
ncbi:isochorismate synthase [Ornithinibacillus californiensis]|uniref:isochorismate synthase n=1 Tax=Ornithinibacillus californiensis TaxID=161536 RepID=UPI00064D8C36|nr:isochorismate synthase [Ornithinibacillus californiensis]